MMEPIAPASSSRTFACALCSALATVLLGGFLASLLVLCAPGYGISEQELDARFSEQSKARLRGQDPARAGVVAFYVRHVWSMVHGDLGVSQSLHRPVAELLRERSRVTAELVGAGLAGGWLLGLALALPMALRRTPGFDLASGVFNGLFLCLPSAVLGLLLLVAGGPVRFGVALVVFPRVFRFCRNLFAHAQALPHVVMARSRGLGRAAILLRHVLPWAAPQLIALSGVSVSMAVGAAIPIEAVCDLPGVGQLAWRAALARDLPVLVSLTLAVTGITVVANSAADSLAAACGRARR